jgi:hypothetical protein
MWRMNLDEQNTPTGDFFRDDCVRGAFMWSLRQDQFIRASSERTVPRQYDIRPSAGGAGRWLWAFPTGGITLVGLDGFAVPHAVRTGDNWEADAGTVGTPSATTPAKTLHLSGTWDNSTGVGTVNLVRWRGPTPGSEDSDLLAEQWDTSAAFGQRIAHRIREVRADGRPLRTYTLIEATTVDRAEIERVTTEPTPGGSDAVRGKSRYTSIFDFTGGEGTVTVVDDQKPPAVAPYHEGRSRAHYDLQRTGWWAAGTLCLALVILRVRKHFVSSKPSGSSADRAA